MITTVFESKGIGGFAILNNRLKVKPESIIMLAEAAGGQVETFKTAMGQQGIKFPDDTGGIILPGQPGFTPSPLRLG